jgi:tetratricopeptide (TPR) repeat protein
MATGRNAPCPCGSGNKYKKCCLLQHERDAAARRALTPQPASPIVMLPDDDGLDDLSNSVIDLVKTRRFDEALSVCRQLLQDFPDVDDGLDRSGMVHAAMGDHAAAAAFYRKALAFVTHPSRAPQYDDPGLANLYRQLIEKEDRLANAP